tara:strand:+ start:343 stop:546 length:204 start_codon:yes stop_codon:yes gene_type:complete
MSPIRSSVAVPIDIADPGCPGMGPALERRALGLVVIFKRDPFTGDHRLAVAFFSGLLDLGIGDALRP